VKIIIYVEGPSDRDSLSTLLASLITQAVQGGCLIQFIPMEGKRPLLTKVPLRAVNILRNDRKARVFALPDLYPPDIVHPHSSYDQLKQVLIDDFRNECGRLKVDPIPLLGRFHVHCLKYDLEVLLLAAEEQLKRRLGLQTFPAKIRWRKPVEDQDHQRPPKRVIEELFQHAKRRYIDTVDAPLILGGADPFNIASKCTQCFEPFLNDLLKLAGII
jgi:hypothetical protein